MAKVRPVPGREMKQNISRFIAACHRGDEGEKKRERENRSYRETRPEEG